MTVSVIGTGVYLPEKILTNSDLEKIVETSDQWIFERTGIRERRIAPDGVSTSDMASHAAQKALKDAGIESSEIDLLIVTTMTPDMLCPSTACLVQRKIGAVHAVCFDLSAACSGFIFGLETAKNFLSSGKYKTAMVIGAEKVSSLVDWTDRGTCILFGDGAGAAVLRVSDQGHRLMNSILGSDGHGADCLEIPAGASRMPATHETVDGKLHAIKMEGREVYKRAIDVMSRVALDTVAGCGLEIKDIDLFIPHQANKRIIDSVAKKLSFPEEKIFINVDRYGNTSAASVIIALDEAKRQGRMKAGDYVLMVAFGAGFTWGGMIIEW